MNKYIYYLINEIGLRMGGMYALAPETLVSDLLKEEDYTVEDWYEVLIQSQLVYGVYIGDPRQIPTDLTIAGLSEFLAKGYQVPDEQYEMFFINWYPVLDAIAVAAEKLAGAKTQKTRDKYLQKVNTAMDEAVVELYAMQAGEYDDPEIDEDEFLYDEFGNFITEEEINKPVGFADDKGDDGDSDTDDDDDNDDDDKPSGRKNNIFPIK